jgi:hypothetical protein
MHKKKAPSSTPKGQKWVSVEPTWQRIAGSAGIEHDDLDVRQQRRDGGTKPATAGSHAWPKKVSNR